MEISARNSLKGVIKQITPGTVNAELIIEVAPGVEIVSMITKSSVDRLKLSTGSEVYAVIKASDVMLATS
jgi:molybdopterin-binding protein